MSFDAEWFGDCVNTFHEEQKQLVYAPRMGLQADWNCGHPPTFDLHGRSVMDIGGGPASLLLKCVNGGRLVVLDPVDYPGWVIDRYLAHGVEYWMIPGEEIEGYTFDEVWIYNVLQHVTSPGLVIKRARQLAEIIRIFEWLDVPAYDGHPNELAMDDLERWLGGKGFATTLNEQGAVGRAFYGVFAAR